MVWFGTDTPSASAGNVDAQLSNILTAVQGLLASAAANNTTLSAISSGLVSTNATLAQVSSSLGIQTPILTAIRDGKAIEANTKLATTVSGSNASIQILPARPTRRYALITLRSYAGSNGVYLAHGATAVLNSGEALLNVGSTYQIDLNNFNTKSINAISDAVFSLSIEEFYD